MYIDKIERRFYFNSFWKSECKYLCSWIHYLVPMNVTVFQDVRGFFFGRTICTVGNLSSFIRRFQFNSSLHCRPWAGQAHHEALAVSPSSMSAWSLAAFHFTSWEEGFLKKKKSWEEGDQQEAFFFFFLKKKLYGLLLVLSLTARVGPAPRELWTERKMIFQYV